MKHLKTIAAFSVALIFSPALSSAQTVISSLPYTISTAGVYVLNQSFSYPSGSGAAITIKASNVTLNLNGHGITNTAAQNSSNTAIAIHASNFENITVENGEILGFNAGILLEGPTIGINFNVGHVIQGMRLAYSLTFGIWLEWCANCSIQNCQLYSMGTTGGGVTVNTPTYGIEVDSFNGGNRIYRNQVTNSFFGYYGLNHGASQGSYFEQNLATNCTYSFTFDPLNAYRDNASFGAATQAFAGGNSVGGNYAQ